jgi:hypothetical protein
MSKVPSQSTGKGGTKQHSIPIPNSQGPRTSSCHCRICHCTTPRLDALHRHPSSLNRSPRYPNLRTPLHIAPKTKIINPKYSPASLPAHSTAQLNPQNAPTPLYQTPMHTRVYYTHPHTFQNPPNPPTTVQHEHRTPPTPHKTLVPRLGTQSRTHAASRVPSPHPQTRTRALGPTARRASMAPPDGAQYEQPLPTLTRPARRLSVSQRRRRVRDEMAAYVRSFFSLSIRQSERPPIRRVRACARAILGYLPTYLALSAYVLLGTG